MSSYPRAGSSSNIPAWYRDDSHDEMDGTDDDNENIFRGLSFEEILEELIARFMVNLPRAELTPVRLYWQAEQAHWFYDDYLRPLNPALPPLSQKHFSRVIIASSPLYSNLRDENGIPIDYDLTWKRYTEYKKMVPTCGVILINKAETKTLLVRHFGGKHFSWPKGKINEKEEDHNCAIRELEEETGYDCSRTINKDDKVECYINGQRSVMFIVTGVDEDYPFAAKTRNEIEECRWVKLKSLPTWSKGRRQGTVKFFKVAPFVHALEHFLGARKQGQKRNNRSGNQQRLQASVRDDASVPSSVNVRSVPNISAHPITEPVTALDKLFANFMHGQEADLQRAGPAGDEDNRDGLERLFGNVTISEQSKHEEKEDDALARLLGAIGTSATPAPTLPPPAQDAGRARLLSVLNQKPPATPPRQTPSATQPESQTPKPHTAHLLAMLAPSSQTKTAPSQPSVPSPAQHDSSSSTPRQPSPPEIDRMNKQRALLEMTLAGIGLESTPNRPLNQNQGLYGASDNGNNTHAVSYNEPPGVSPAQMAGQQQYRPPAQPAAFPPTTGAYYTANPVQPLPPQHAAQGYPNGPGPGPSPPRNRGAPPPYDSHFGVPGQGRPMPPVVPAQPAHDYPIHPQAPGGYYARPPQVNMTQGPAYRPHPPPQQQQQQQPPFSSGFQQPYASPPNQFQPVYHNGLPTGYAPGALRHPPNQGNQVQSTHPQMQQQQQPYIPSVQGNGSNGGNVHHTGPMHQPIPKSGPQSGLLAMLNEGRGR